MVSLTPVLELSPGTYSQRERSLPAGSAEENPSGWQAYWSESLADAGIHRLLPWRAGSWLVPLPRLSSDSVLGIIVRCHVQDVSDWSNELGALAGGYILSVPGEALLPGCCGDLTNLVEWRKASTDAGEAWQMVWIGHPWTFVRRSGDHLQFAKPSENNDPIDVVAGISVSKDDLAEAIVSAELEVRAFAARLLAVTRELQPPIAHTEVVEALTGIRLPD